MNLDDFSVDAETLSQKYDAPIIAIGAVHFNRVTGKLGQTFYQEITIDSALKAGRPSGECLQWWFGQSAKARQVFVEKAEGKFSLATVLMNFSTWCRSTAVGGAPRVWAKGPSNDVTWIERAMEVGGHGLTVPWHYRNIRDVRTILELAEEIAGFDVSKVPNVGTAHNALDDAVYQANVICAARAALSSYNPAQRQKVAKMALARPIEDDEL